MFESNMNSFWGNISEETPRHRSGGFFKHEFIGASDQNAACLHFARDFRWEFSSPK